MALTGLGIAAALALAKNQLVDQPAAKRQRQLAADTQRYSPWTGLTAGQVQEPNLFGDVLDYGATGAMMGRGYGKDKAAAAEKAAAQGNELEAEFNAMPGGVGKPTMAKGGAGNPWEFGGGISDTPMTRKRGLMTYTG